MKNLKFILWIFCLWLFQTVFLRFIRVNGTAPEMLYIFVLCVAMLEKNPKYYIGIGVVCGFIADVSVGGVPGFYILVYSVSVLLIVWLLDIIYKDNNFLLLPVTIIFSFLTNTLIFFVNHDSFHGLNYLTVLTAIIVPVIIYNCIVALIINLLLKKTIYRREKQNGRR